MPHVLDSRTAEIVAEADDPASPIALRFVQLGEDDLAPQSNWCPRAAVVPWARY